MKKGYVVCVYENIKDQELLNNYASKSKSAVDKYKGIFLVRGGNKITTEGKEFVRTDYYCSNKFFSFSCNLISSSYQKNTLIFINSTF